MKKNKSTIFLVVIFSLLLGSTPAGAANLSGRILLQVEDKGQAWYVNPLDNARYYLGRPDDAFRIMREFGLGVSNSDLNNFLSRQAPKHLAGRILLQVEDKGQAFFIEPLSLKLHYLGRPLDAFNVIRSLGLGISNNDLKTIKISPQSAPEPQQTIPQPQQPDPNSNQPSADLVVRNYHFKYQSSDYQLSLNLSTKLFEAYRKLPKVYSYLVNEPPPNIREAFYEMFLQPGQDDRILDELLNNLKSLANQQGFKQDQLLEFIFAFVQYIPYDEEKALSQVSNPFYPYETLYSNKGVCSDKTFLAHALLERLGYGVAIMDFPDINHSVLGILCPSGDSIRGSGYCYAETTNYFPIGVIPKNIDGQALSPESNDFGFNTLFSDVKLGELEILNKKAGQSYQGVSLTKEKAAELNRIYQEIVSSQNNLGHNKAAVEAYNKKVELFNQRLKDFYQF